MRTHPLWRPFALADLAEVAQARVGAPPPRLVTVVPYDPAWPEAYEQVAARVRSALGDAVLTLEHVGSTAVPGLAAKAVVDVDLTVADPADEASWLPPLERAGFVLRVREPGWDEHRVLTLESPVTNLHVWPPGAPEPARHVLFRDWLRRDAVDREAYAALKLALGRRGFTDGMDYNNHKAALVYDVYERAFAADPAHPHDPHPR
ncbi:GrpB family protein [Nocardioides perillae]|uniref:GrpB-like predicted nucleotidyltransferase (UPF0157 family) n=1 Tax=Nocardioides perillae TaxID=1119534 RepID=A0A7Y9UM85_9ACTN|nr:GrpB-like predicted nucleotidyltransferase (UPF0157 family) [Nocardioides perillae]